MHYSLCLFSSTRKEGPILPLKVCLFLSAYMVMAFCFRALVVPPKILDRSYAYDEVFFS